MTEPESAAGWADLLRPLVAAAMDGTAEIHTEAAWLLRGALMSAELIAGLPTTEGRLSGADLTRGAADADDFAERFVDFAASLDALPPSYAVAIDRYRDQLEVRWLELTVGVVEPNGPDEWTLLTGALLCIDELQRAVQHGAHGQG